MFHDVRFPTTIKYQSMGGPEFSTEVIVLGNGHEVRNVNWANARERWDVSIGMDSRTNFDTVSAFFYARQGKAYGFRFKNHDDYQGAAEELGTGDGATVDYQIVKNYTSGATTHARTILKPVSGTVQVYLDSVEQMSGWSVDVSTGVITFSSPPASGEVVTATYEFDIPVRFDVDYFPRRFDNFDVRGGSVLLLELKNA